MTFEESFCLVIDKALSGDFSSLDGFHNMSALTQAALWKRSARGPKLVFDALENIGVHTALTHGSNGVTVEVFCVTACMVT